MGGMLMATQGPSEVVALAVILVVLDAVAVLLRFYARRRKKQQLLADDWFTIPALLLNIGMATVLIYGVAKHVYGYPTPVGDGPPPSKRNLLLSRTSWAQVGETITIASEGEWAFFILGIPALGCIKLSLLFFYQRVFVVGKRDFRDPMNVSVIIMMVIVAMWTVAFWLRYLFACKTHPDIWWTSAEQVITKCGNFNVILNWLAITDFACDVIILLMPLPKVWKLRMPVSQKIAVTGVFMLGSFATASSLIRLIWVVWQANQHFNPDLDVDLLITTFLFWNFLEVSVGLLAACFPTLRSLIQTRSIDSVVQSVRSRISLPSLRSITQRSGRSTQGSIAESESHLPTHSDDYSVISGKNSTQKSRVEVVNSYPMSDFGHKTVPSGNGP